MVLLMLFPSTIVCRLAVGSHLEVELPGCNASFVGCSLVMQPPVEHLWVSVAFLHVLFNFKNYMCIHVRRRYICI